MSTHSCKVWRSIFFSFYFVVRNLLYSSQTSLTVEQTLACSFLRWSWEWVRSHTKKCQNQDLTPQSYFFKTHTLSMSLFIGMIEMRPKGGLNYPRAAIHSCKGTSKLALNSVFTSEYIPFSFFYPDNLAPPCRHPCGLRTKQYFAGITKMLIENYSNCYSPSFIEI